MTRTDLINSIIARRGYRSYLEVGVKDVDYHFAHVRCERKCGVDPDPAVAGIAWHMGSDAFFRANTAGFDLIFIDGLHEEAQVDTDLCNALRCLNPGGVIVLHDCLPPDEWHQRPAAEYRAGDNWNGTVWKSALKCFAASPWKCCVVDCDWGCGVIDTAAPAERPALRLPERLEYGRDFAALRAYTVSAADFLAGLYRVAVFYHVAGMGDWREIVAEHFRLLRAVRLRRLIVTHVGGRDDLAYLEEAAAGCGLEMTLGRHAEDLKLFETPAMYAIEEWAGCSDGCALYFHTKGVSAPGSPHKRKWRELMNREVIGRWQENVRALDGCDVVGVNWRNCPPIAHFCGNFWWARADYLRQLAPFDAYYRRPRYPSDWEDGLRLGCEFWIGSAARPPRVRSLVCSDQDFCDGRSLDRFA
jgi:hypothetical protein